MSSKIAFDVDVLTDQAKKVDQLARDVSAATSSLGAGLGGQAFGTLGGFLVSAVQGVGGVASGVCGDLQEALEDTADQLRAVAADVRETEYEIAASMREFEREIEYAGAR